MSPAQPISESVIASTRVPGSGHLISGQVVVAIAIVTLLAIAMREKALGSGGA